MGHSAEFYTNNEQSNSILSHRMILKEFGAAEQLADDMLNDQGKKGNYICCIRAYNCSLHKFIIF